MFHLSFPNLSPWFQAPGELGVQPPVGFWDPLGLSADGDTEVFKRRTLAEPVKLFKLTFDAVSSVLL